MRSIRSIVRPRRADLWVWVLTFGPGAIVLAAVWFQSSVSVSVLFKDPLAVAQMMDDCCEFYYGLVSNLGVMIWTAGAGICLFTSVLLFSRARPRSEVLFFAAAAVFTGWLTLDDLFMLHEWVLPDYGVPQTVTFGSYAAVAVVYSLLSWRYILALRPVLMASALGLLGSSVVIDALVHTEGKTQVFFEDGTKLLGILAWTSFHVLAAFEMIGPSRPAESTSR